MGNSCVQTHSKDPLSVTGTNNSIPLHENTLRFKCLW